METSIYLYSIKSGEIKKFLNSFYADSITIENDLKWSKHFENPVEINDIIGTFVENNDKFQINMWLCLDKGIYINVTDSNADQLIRYIYERFPY